MSVYVDNAFIPFGNMLMCHMVADTTDELLAMVDKIGVKRKWIQYPGTYEEHFDIAKGKRELAISFGAIPIDWREYPDKVNAKRDKNETNLSNNNETKA